LENVAIHPDSDKSRTVPRLFERAPPAPLFIGGAETKGLLPAITRALAPHLPGARTAMVPSARHWMFEQAPQEFSEIVLEFLAG
jgi:pimeloyl-ACP methyl ester carboxylesterase